MTNVWILNVNLIMITWNTFFFINVENIKWFKTLNTSDSIIIWEWRVTVSRFWICQLISWNISRSTWISLDLTLGTHESSHVSIILSSCWFAYTFQLVNIEIITSYTSCPIKIRSPRWTIVIVFGCFVLLKYIDSLFYNFSKILGDPLGILKHS